LAMVSSPSTSPAPPMGTAMKLRIPATRYSASQSCGCGTAAAAAAHEAVGLTRCSKLTACCHRSRSCQTYHSQLSQYPISYCCPPISYCCPAPNPSQTPAPITPWELDLMLADVAGVAAKTPLPSTCTFTFTHKTQPPTPHPHHPPSGRLPGSHLWQCECLVVILHAVVDVVGVAVQQEG
jgi:hypothetical protein